MANPKVNQHVIGTANFTKLDGSPGMADPTQTPVLTSDNEGIATMQNAVIAPDGMSATVEVWGMGTAGVANVTMEVDADLGAGVTPIVIAGAVVFDPLDNIVGGTFSFGEPIDN